MAMPEPQRNSFDQIRILINQLSPAEQERLRRELNNKSWGDEWDSLVKEVRQESKKFPLSEEEIFTEINAIKQELKAERAQGSN